MNSETKTCQSCKSPFLIESDDFTFYERVGFPAPKDCPVCRQRRRMIFRNFKTLYKRNSDRSSKPMISMYAPHAPYKVFTHEEWWADNWDARQYGRDFDFSRPFFEQFKELLLAVPKTNLQSVQSENCEYSNFAWKSKNCYLVFGCVDNDTCAYGHIVWESKDSVDNLYLYKSELCYECVDCLWCYGLKWSQECESCSESIGLFDCRSCTNCIGCVGLKQKSYCIFNEPVGKVKYEQFLREHPLTDPATLPYILKKQRELRRQIPQRHFFGSHNNGVSGNHIYHAKNVHYSFDVKGGENSKFAYTTRKVVDSYDVAFSPDIELAYQALTSRGNGIYFAHLNYDCSDIYYSDNCTSVHNAFGCVGLKSGEYLILNKQYSKDEYEKMRMRIIEHMKKTGEWGEFFPTSLSPFAYNESIAQEYFPMQKEEALAAGFRWEENIPRTSGQETITHDALPKNPAEFDAESLLKQVLQCETCGYNYRFTAQEIPFYKRLNILLPRQCFNCRHERRMKQRNMRKLWDGNCAKCGAKFKTSYSPEQQKEHKIYCESCYQSEMG
ncbi:MAG: hypothetical protein HYW65_03905 [Candidatus Liptonbacteria bacterium]|nr:hypothetical protein [Candidatus Liptonbacteria bacterium]